MFKRVFFYDSIDYVSILPNPPTHHVSKRKHLTTPIHPLFWLQQGLEMRGFWFQKKTVQLKTVLREVYTYVLKWFFFQKTV